mgnify:CR=1 FL=1
MTAMYASKRPSAKDFHVPANSVEFTEAHLKKHLKEEIAQVNKIKARIKYQ